MRNVLVVLIVLLSASVAMADGPTAAYRYVDASGTVSFTDDVKRVPAKYRNIAEKVTLGTLGNYERFTEVTTTTTTEGSTRLETLRSSNVVAAPIVEVCDGPVTVTQERRERTPKVASWTGSNSYNSMFYVVRDSCGNEKSVTLTNPLPVVN